MLRKSFHYIVSRLPLYRKYRFYSRVYYFLTKKSPINTRIAVSRALLHAIFSRVSTEMIQSGSMLVYREERYCVLQKNMMEAFMKQFDVISFDIFDTLVYRNVQIPTDIFKMMERQIGLISFAQERVRAEDEARRNRKNVYGDSEANIVEIYEQLPKRFLEAHPNLMELEVEMELKHCAADAGMLDIYKMAKALNKTVVLTSDMYLPRRYLEQILNKCRIEKYNMLLISCECRTSKSQGELYNQLAGSMPEHAKILHIGDNFFSDVVSAAVHGVMPVHYIR